MVSHSYRHHSGLCVVVHACPCLGSVFQGLVYISLSIRDMLVPEYICLGVVVQSLRIEDYLHKFVLVPDYICLGALVLG